ncbi:Protoporphyrinogen IX dehydrogenase [menaquinone] [Pantoea agglomerans]|uniref:Protoporphyrinogen IX dehydrogenase [menaquinone] n=1 Tax=Enterobacter agglomerans TaxID=549 RepID=A0A379ANZ9_ENTAG|nr:Protoporphyrinogen IX dehydrogenase [menaquinone] [Pantoea agglomerans]
MKALILYSTRDGQTRKIASSIADVIRQQQQCDVLNIQDATLPDWAQYDRVLIGRIYPLWPFSAGRR